MDPRIRIARDYCYFAIPGFVLLCCTYIYIMEDLIIPGWFIVLTGIIGGAFLSWAVWITAKVNSNDKEIALNTQADKTVKEKILEVKEDLNDRMDKMERHFDGKFDQVFKRIGELKR